MKKLISQTVLLLVAYYFAPDLITDFLSDVSGEVSYYSVLFFKVAVVVLTTISLLRGRRQVEKGVVDFAKGQLKLRQSDAILSRFSNLLVQLLFVVLIVMISIPLLKYFLSTKILTVIKLVVVAYCVFLGWGIYKLFDVEEKVAESDENANI